MIVRHAPMQQKKGAERPLRIAEGAESNHVVMLMLRTLDSGGTPTQTRRSPTTPSPRGRGRSGIPKKTKRIRRYTTPLIVAIWSGPIFVSIAGDQTCRLKRAILTTPVSLTLSGCVGHVIR